MVESGEVASPRLQCHCSVLLLYYDPAVPAGVAPAYPTSEEGTFAAMLEDQKWQTRSDSHGDLNASKACALGVTLRVQKWSPRRDFNARSSIPEIDVLGQATLRRGNGPAGGILTHDLADPIGTE